MKNLQHNHFMQRALELAQHGRYTVSPNPMVGCVIVKEGNIVGEGFHLQAGHAHAEINALNNAGNKAQNATLYLSLEPCAHVGKTQPCTDTIISSGIAKVYVATLDPNPLVSGKGVDALRSAGIDVEIGLCQQKALELNEIFFHYITQRRPFVISKWAMSLDGKTITHHSDSPQISSLESQYYSHHLRQSVDAILVGASTVRCDNPQLTARLSLDNVKIHKQPTRIVLSTSGHLPESAHVFRENNPGKTIVVSTVKIPSALFSKTTVENIVIPKNKSGQLDLSILLDELGRREITSLLIEGGMTTHQSFLHENLIDKFHVYIAPILIGSHLKKMETECVSSSKLGNDFHFVTRKKGEH